MISYFSINNESAYYYAANLCNVRFVISENKCDVQVYEANHTIIFIIKRGTFDD